METLDTQTRDSDRCIIDDEAFASILFERIQRFVPFEYRMGMKKKSGWRVVGLNERMRILRYGSGQSFAGHYDGTFRRDLSAGDHAGETSMCTVMIYLNSATTGDEDEDEAFINSNAQDVMSTAKDNISGVNLPTCQGGATRLIAEDFTSKDEVVLPKVGRVLIFDHRLLHQGDSVDSGWKYAIRTDLMYQKTEVDG